MQLIAALNCSETELLDSKKCSFCETDFLNTL